MDVAMFVRLATREMIEGFLQTLTGQREPNEQDVNLKQQLRELPQLKQARDEELSYLFTEHIEFREEEEAMGIAFLRMLRRS
jgi:hypothetical protein